MSSVVQSGPQIDTTTPDVTGVTASPATGAEVVGNTITFTVNMSEAVTVAGGTPTLTLNDGGTATYASGSGTNALTFNYTVMSTDTAVSSLAITAVNVPTGVTIADGAGNAANMAARSLHSRVFLSTRLSQSRNTWPARPRSMRQETLR